MNIAITGHRPARMLGYEDNPTYQSIRDRMRRILIEKSANTELFVDEAASKAPVVVLSGMALGIDQWFTEIAIQLGIPVHAFLPFKNYERTWPYAAQKHYRDLLAKCDMITHVYEDDRYDPKRLMERNKRMIDEAQLLVAVFDGKSGGGTADAVRYANTCKVPIIHIPFVKE